MAYGKQIEGYVEEVMKIPYSHQAVDKSDIREVIKVLRSDWLTQGPKVPEFEERLCRYTGAKYAVCVSSGTAALHIACLAAGVKPGVEVITSPLTFAASANCALYCGGKPVFADVSRDTANIDPRELAKKITRKTRVVIPVHFAGLPCEMKEISSLARARKITVIEDACHALGAVYKAKKIGSCSHSDMSVFSFHPLKSITTGEGGAVLTNSKELYGRLLLYRNHGITKERSRLLRRNEGGWFYEMQELGFNYRMTDIQAALGISQLKKADLFIAARRRVASVYDRAFAGNPYFDIPPVSAGYFSAYHLYPIRIKGEDPSRKRRRIFDALRKKGIGVQVHYIPVYRHPFYKRLGPGRADCPNAEDYYSRELSIPLYPSMRKAQIRFVIESLLRVAGEGQL